MNHPINPQCNNRRTRRSLTPDHPSPPSKDSASGEAPWPMSVPGQILWKADPVGAMTELNPTWQTYTGMDPANSLAEGFLQGIHPEDRPMWRQGLSQPKTPSELTQKPLGVAGCEMELRLLGSDGLYRWMLVQAFPIWGPSGELLGWQGSYTDIDRLKQTQLQLQEKQEFIENLIASCSDAIIAGDAQGQLQIFNQAAQDLYGGAAPNPPQGAPESHLREPQPPGDGVNPARSALERLPLWEALQTERPSETELVVTPQTGKPRIMLANSHPIFNDQGMKLGAVTLMRDITKQKQREQACFSLYAETQEEVRVLRSQSPDSPSLLPLVESHSPVADAEASGDEEEAQRLSRIENEEEFTKLFQTLDVISAYSMAGLLWDQSGEWQGVMNCHRLLADSLWERLERLLLVALTGQNGRALHQPEAVGWSIALPDGQDDEVPMTELVSLVVFPVLAQGNAQKGGLLFIVPEGRSALSAYELELLEGILHQASELLRKLSLADLDNSQTHPGPGNSMGDRHQGGPTTATPEEFPALALAAIAPEPSTQLTPETLTRASRECTGNSRVGNGVLGGPGSASAPPSPPKRADRRESGSAAIAPPSIPTTPVSPSLNWGGKSPRLNGHPGNIFNPNRPRLLNPEGDHRPPRSFPVSSDPNNKPPLEPPQNQRSSQTRQPSDLHDSVHYHTEMEGGRSTNIREQLPNYQALAAASGFDNTPGDKGILIYDADGILSTCNLAVERILGLRIPELLGRSYHDAGYSSIFPNGSPVEGDRHPIAIAFNTGEPQSNTILGIYKPDDTLTWVSLNLQPLFDMKGEQQAPSPCTVIVYLQEMANFTEVSDSPRQLPDPQYQWMVEQSPDLIARYSPEGLYLYASGACRSLFGYEPEELVGQSLYEFVHPEDLAAVTRIFEHLTEETPSAPVPYRHRRKDGAYIWLETTLGMADHPGFGQPSPAIAVSREITLRQQQDTKIALLNQDLERLVRKQRLELDNVRQLKDELLLREQLARKVAEATKTLLSKERQRIAESRLFLAEATTLLTASLDYQTTLENLGRLLVPRFADGCVINVKEPDTESDDPSDGDYRCVKIACLDPAKQAAVRTLQQRYPVNEDGRYSYLQQLGELRRSQLRSDWGERENGAEFCFGITDDELVAVAEDSEHLDLLRSLDFQAYLWLPICFGDRTFGSILLLCGNPSSSRRVQLEKANAAYTPSDLSLVEDVVRRGAMTLEKALLYREARETGENLRKTVSILGERQRQLRTLQQLANLLNQRIADLPRLLQLMVEAVCEAIPKAQFCLIVLHDHQRNHLELMATSGTGTQNLPIGIPLKTKDCLLSEVFTTGQSQLRCHSLDGVSSDSQTEIIPGDLPACVYAVPIESARAGRLGVLAVGNWEDFGAFEVEDLRQMVTAVGEQAAIAINNARSIEILEERDQLLQAQNHTLACQNQELEAKRQQIERQNSQLREASRLKSEFLATMSHELRTPMNSILGFSQLLLRGRRYPLAPPQTDMVERILKNGQQLLALINDILDLSKIEAGHSELKLEEFEVDLLVRATCEELRIFAQHKNLTLQFHSSLDNPRVVGDRLRLRQVVSNLISNAIKFTTTGTVEVSVSSLDPDSVEILIKDTGIGIPPEQLNHIFEVFRQGDQTITREYSGTGVGLALCDSLVRLMQGTISVESQLNQGSTFSIQIPRSISDEVEKQRFFH